jgi:CRISPR-associated endonuclease Cas2
MLHVIVYDITDYNLRRLTAEILKDYGLKRIQKSVFAGMLKKYDVHSLVIDLSRIITVDSIIIFPLCESDFSNMTSIGQEVIKELENEVVEFY